MFIDFCFCMMFHLKVKPFLIYFLFKWTNLKLRSLRLAGYLSINSNDCNSVCYISDYLNGYPTDIYASLSKLIYFYICGQNIKTKLTEMYYLTQDPHCSRTPNASLIVCYLVFPCACFGVLFFYYFHFWSVPPSA